MIISATIQTLYDADALSRRSHYDVNITVRFWSNVNFKGRQCMF